jgi:hypothetical protein
MGGLSNGNSITRLPRIAPAIWVAVVVFLATRVWILLVPTIEESSAGLYAVLGYESRIAQLQGRSVYAVHEQRVTARQEAAARETGRPIDPSLRMIEYPPLAIAWMTLPTYLGPPFRDDFKITEEQVRVCAAGFRWMMAGVDLLTFAALVWLLGRMYPGDPRAQMWRLMLYAGAGLVLHHLLYDRFDLTTGCLVVIGLALLVSRVHWSAALLVLGVAVNLKLVPVLLAPVFVLGATPLAAFRSIGSLVGAIVVRSVVFLAICTAIILPFYLRDGSRTLDFLRYHSERGVQVESTPATLLLLQNSARTLVFTHGAMDLTDSPGTRLAATLSTLFTIALVLAVTAAAIAWAWRTGRRSTIGIPLTLAQAQPATTAMFSLLMLWAAMTTAKVFSPQYLLWVLPLIVLTPGTRQSRLLIAIGFLALCALTTAIFPHRYWSDIVRPQPDFTLLPPTPFGLTLLTLRNGLFVLMLAGLIAVLWRRVSNSARADW